MEMNILASEYSIYPHHRDYVKSNYNFLAYFIIIDVMVEGNQDHFLNT